MRWLVEVTPMGKADSQNYCLDADSWQKALELVRTARRETPGMAGFSIELLEAGYRAVDPMARLRFVVKPAPAGMELTALPNAGIPDAGNASAGNASAGNASAEIPAAAGSGNGPDTLADGPPSTIPEDASTVPSLAAATPADETGPQSTTAPQPAIDRSPPASGRGKGSKKGGKAGPPRAGGGGLQMKKPVQKTVMMGAQGAVAEEVQLRKPSGSQPDDRLDPKTDPPGTVATSTSASSTQTTGTSAPSTHPIGTSAGVTGPSSPAAPLSSTSQLFAAAGSDPMMEVEIVRSEPPAKVASTVQALQAANAAQGRADSGDLIVEIQRSDPPAMPAPNPGSVGSIVAGFPVVELLTKREQEPDAKSPIVYREYAFSIAPGTSEVNAERALMGQLELVKKKIAGYSSRKFVNLAVFDMKFTGKPPGPPLVTITWKDWSGAPVIAYPKQGKKGSIIPPKKVSVPPPAIAAAASSVTFPSNTPAPVGVTVGFEAVSQTAPMVSPAQPSQQPSAPQPTAQTFSASTQPIMQVAAAFPLPNDAPSPPRGSQAPVETRAPSHAPAPPQSFAPAPQSFAPAPPAPNLSQTQPLAQSQPLAQPQAPQPQGPHSQGPQAQPISQADPFKAPVMSAEPPRAKTPSRPPSGRMTPVPTRSSAKLVAVGAHRGRTSGDELISALFEAMHDLHFLRDALEGGDFCLALANEMMPCRASIVHVYDVNKRNFIAACATGAGTEALLGKRTPDSDLMLFRAMKTRKSLVTVDATQGDPAAVDRYRLLGGAKSVIVTPVMFGARSLASIEMMNPLDGQPFTEDEGHAMNYIAEQFAEFIGSHGLVLETDKILAHKSSPNA